MKISNRQHGFGALTLVCALFLCAGAGSARGSTYVGKASDTKYCPDGNGGVAGNGDTGDWYNACNWSPKGVPTAADSADIPGTFGVHIDRNTTVDDLSLSGGTLTARDNSTLTVGGTFEWSGGTLGGPGTFLIIGSADAHLTGPSTKQISGGATLQVNGKALWDGGNLSNYADGAIYNDGEFTIQTDGTLASTENHAYDPRGFQNRGQLIKQGGGGAATIEWVFINHSVVDVRTGTLALTGDSSEISPAPTTANDGTFQAAEGTTIEFSGGTHNFASDARFIGAGKSRLTGGVMATYGTPQIGIQGGASGIFEIAGGNLNPGNNTGGQGITPTGALICADTGTLMISGGTVGTAQVKPGGTVFWSGGTLAGTVDIPAGASLNVTGDGDKVIDGYGKVNYGNERLPGVLNVGGTTTWTGAGRIFLKYSARIDNTGTFTAMSDASVECDAFDVTFANGGTFRKTGSTGTTLFNKTCNDLIFDNTGTVDVQSGVVGFKGGHTNFHDGSQFAGAGVIRFESGPLTLEGGMNLQDGGTFELAGGSLFGTTGAVHGPGTFLWTGGSIVGKLTVAADGRIQIAGDARKTLDGYNLANSGDATRPGILDNAGTALWDGAGTLFLNSQATLDNSGTFTANSDATVTCDGFTNTVNNTGTLEKAGGTGETLFTRACNDLVLHNAGTMRAKSGTLLLDNVSGGGGGTYDAGPGAAIEFHKGRRDIADGAAFTGTGALRVTGTSLHFKTGDAPTGSMSIAQGTSFDFVSGDIWNHGGVNGGGRLLWESGVLNGELTVGKDATLELAGDGAKNFNGYQNSNYGNADNKAILHNAGTVLWTGAGPVTFDYGATDGSRAYIDNTGTFRITVPAAFKDNSGWGALFDNKGTLDVRAGTDLGNAGFKNSGIVKVAGVDLKAPEGYTQSDGSTELGGGSLTGKVTLNGGTLTGAGSINGSLNNAGGTVDPASDTDTPLTVTGDYTQAAADAPASKPGGTLALDFSNGNDGARKHDLLKVNGAAHLNGTLRVRLADPFALVGTDAFEAVTYGSHQGNFAAVDVQGLAADSHLALAASYGAQALDLLATGTAPTPAGSGVTTVAGDTSVQFDLVTQEGTTTVTAQEAAALIPVLPEGFTLPADAPAMEITTTTTSEGMKEIRLHLPPDFLSALTEEQRKALAVLHLEDGIWVDRTYLAYDPDTGTISVRTPTFSPFVVAIGPGAAPTFPLGDVNRDTAIDVSDAVLALRYIVGAATLEADQVKLGDVTKDGGIDVSDVVLILRRVVGLPTEF